MRGTLTGLIRREDILELCGKKGCDRSDRVILALKLLTSEIPGEGDAALKVSLNSLGEKHFSLSVLFKSGKYVKITVAQMTGSVFEHSYEFGIADAVRKELIPRCRLNQYADQALSEIWFAINDHDGETTVIHKDSFEKILVGSPVCIELPHDLRPFHPNGASVSEFLSLMMVAHRLKVHFPLDVRRLIFFEHVGSITRPALDFAMLSPGEMMVFLLEKMGGFEAKLVQQAKLFASVCAKRAGFVGSHSWGGFVVWGEKREGKPVF